MTTPVDASRMAQRFASSFRIPYDDVLQDVRRSILEHTKKYESLTDVPDCSFSQWLYNKVWQQLRHRYNRARKVREIPVSVYVGSPHLLPGGQVRPNECSFGKASDRLFVQPEKDADVVIDVQDALSRLPENYRELLTAVFLEGRLASEYAARKGISQTAVSHMLRRATAAMKDLLPGYANGL